MSTTTDLTTLKINYLTQAQYDAAVSGGTIEENELYLTPVSNTAITDVKVDGTSVVSSGVAAVDLTGKSDTGHTHTTSDITNFPTIPTITDTYSGTSSNGMSGKAVKSAIDALDGTITGSAGTGKTLSAFSQTDGKVSATFSNISITKSQVSDFPIIPTITDTYLGTSSNGMSGKAVKSAIDALDGTITGSAGTGKTLSAFSQTDGKVSATFSDISITKSQISDFPTIPTITDTYSGTSSNGMSGKAVKSAIDALDGTITGSAGSGKTLTAFSQTDGKVSATFGDISITKSQVSDFPAMPAGLVQMYAGSTAPTGWLMCDGSEVSRTTYATLFSAIGTTYGTGNGSTTFNLPDLRNRFPVGAGSTYSLNSTGGSADAIVPYHRHSVSKVTDGITGGEHAHTAGARSVYTGTGNYQALCGLSNATVTNILINESSSHKHDLPAHNTAYAGESGNATNANLPPYIGINFIISTGD